MIAVVTIGNRRGGIPSESGITHRVWPSQVPAVHRSTADGGHADADFAGIGQLRGACWAHGLAEHGRIWKCLQASLAVCRDERFQLCGAQLLELFHGARCAVLYSLGGHTERLIDPWDQRLRALQVSGSCRVTQQLYCPVDLLRLLRQRSGDDGDPARDPRARIASGGVPRHSTWSVSCCLRPTQA
jgi:hypothetical protein